MSVQLYLTVFAVVFVVTGVGSFVVIYPVMKKEYQQRKNDTERN